jgi:hypothetical protein
MNFSQRTLAALAVVAVLGLGATNAQAAIFIDFGGSPLGTITVNVPSGNSINTATNVTIPTNYVVTTVAAGDQSGLVLTPGSPSTFTINPGTWDLTGTGTELTKSWNANGGTYNEVLDLAKVDRSVSNSLSLFYSGTLTGPGGVNQPAFMQVAFTQSGGPGSGISATITDTSINPIPEPSTVVLAGLGTLGLIGYGVRRRKAMGA